MLVFVPVALVLNGCGADRDGRGPRFVQYDSAGVQVSVTAGSAAHVPLGWEVDSVPEQVIGGGDSPGQALYHVQGVRELSGRQILVVDGGSAELRVFDSRGRLARTAGGRGDGPGEFLNPVLVPDPQNDSLLFFDQGLLRFQLFSDDGRYERGIPIRKRWPAGRRPPLGALHGWMLLERGGFVGGEESLRKDGLHQVSRTYLWFDPSTGKQVVLDSFVVDQSYQLRGGAEPVIPFSARPRAAVTQHGVLISDGRRPEIREYDLQGHVRRILRIDEPRRPVTREMVTMLPLDPFYGWTSRKIVEAVPRPDSLPVFRALEVDDQGWVWAEMYGWDPSAPNEWIVFDGEGRALGSVETPVGLDLGETLSGVELGEVSRNFLLGIRRDSLGVEYVCRYALQRG